MLYRYKLPLLFLILLTIRLSYYSFSDGFALYKIENTFPVTPEWQVPSPSPQQHQALSKICSQKFYYLTKGSQAYAFISEDGTYVLKLFKCYHLKPATWLENLPLPNTCEEWRITALNKRMKKINTALNSYKIATNTLYDECGLVYLQIIPSNEFHQMVTVIDKIGRHYTLDLAQYGFIVQKKATLIYTTFSSWIKNGNIDEAKQALHSIVQLLIQRSLKGVQDSDPDLHKNAGLIGTEEVFIDVGGFHYNPCAKTADVYKRDIRKITKNFREWLHIQSPELGDFFEQSIESVGHISEKSA